MRSDPPAPTVRPSQEVPAPDPDAAKQSFDHVYTQPDPRAYYAELTKLGYCIPELAKPYFRKLIKDYRADRQVDTPTILDVGCSYGINAALLRCDTTMRELAEHYQTAESTGAAELAARDRAMVRSRSGIGDIRFIGLDASEPALDYARAAGFLDDALHADLEQADPTAAQRDQLADVDLVFSTGCIGYVTERTIGRVARAARRRPWMAHFVLRMFSFDAMRAELDRLGYQTEQVDGVFRQRRFADEREQEQVLETLGHSGIDPSGLESEGWFYAQLFISRPHPDAGAIEPSV
ncbi:class I SAM-dependent methyltransferase [Skermania piniformis]|uniref:class I SAM-dependent methyltransferase n=1 Tax=Skermania pinensis TaxID=39122 RepID=UPI000A7F769E|nr:class I SAM-dependent methyltransferase [Skermania piniformis]